MDTVIVIPTYNEAEYITALIGRIRQLYPEFDILVVDDNSPDGTGGLVERIASSDPRVTVLHRLKKDGLGKAYVQGFQHALSRKPPYARFVQMDADFSHDPVYISGLLDALQGSKLSIGSRYVPGGVVTDWRLDRRILSLAANLFVRSWLGISVRDCTSGFRCFRREALEGISLDTIKSNGYYFQIEMVLRCRRLHYRLTEVPIRFSERKKGKTKLGLAEIWEALWGVFFFRFLR